MDERDLAALLAEHSEHHGVPGAALGVVHAGSRLVATHGVADVHTRQPVTAETRFSIGSLTKPMVATALLIAAEEGRLDLDDPVAQRVPELQRTSWARSATVRDLMANRSRVPLRDSSEFGFDNHPETDDAALSRLAATADRDTGWPTPTWSYSNLGWCLAGRALEVAAGAPWEVAMRRLLSAAEMVHTSLGPPTGEHPLATGHDVGGAEPEPVARIAPCAYTPAGATATSTIEDLLGFAELQLVSSELAALRVLHAPVSIPGWLDGWCLGWAVYAWEGGTAWGWEGLVPGERAALRLIPEQRTAVALLTNASNGRALLATLLTDLVPRVSSLHPTPLGLRPREGDAGDLSRFAGRYAWPDHEVVASVEDRALRIHSPQDVATALPLDDRTFVVDAADPDTPTVTFGDFGEDGRPGVLYDMIWGLPRVGDS